MKTEDVIKLLLTTQGITQEMLAKRIGMERRYVNNLLRRDSMTVKNLRRLVGALGCKVVIMPDTVETPEGGYEIE